MKNNYPDSLTIQQYHDGLLDPESMHQLEKQALEDPFLADALEGYSFAENSGEHLSFLQRQLHERIVHLQENKKVFDMSWQRLSVAAAAAVLFISAGILFWMNNIKSQPELAANQKQVEVNLTPADSLFKDERPVLKPAESVGSIPIPERELVAKNTMAAPSNVRSAPDEAGNLNEVIVTSHGSQQKTESQYATSTAAAAEDAKSAALEAEKEKARMEVSRLSRSSSSAKLQASGIENLNERVITDSNAQPEGGWLNFNRYLLSNLRIPKNAPALKGVVIISSQIRNNGSLKNFEVIQSLHPEYDKEAIRLVKEGPRWKTLSDNIKEVKIAVTF